jgi:hypothetical protein
MLSPYAAVLNGNHNGHTDIAPSHKSSGKGKRVGADKHPTR